MSCSTEHALVNFTDVSESMAIQQALSLISSKNIATLVFMYEGTVEMKDGLHRKSVYRYKPYVIVPYIIFYLNFPFSKVNNFLFC